MRDRGLVEGDSGRIEDEENCCRVEGRGQVMGE
jgi:hypothetical protein